MHFYWQNSHMQGLSVQLSQQITLYKDFRILRIVFTFRWGILSRMWSDHWLPSILVFSMYFNSNWQVKDTTAFICLLNRDHYTNRNETKCPGNTSTHLSCHFQYSEKSTYIEHDSALKTKTSYVKYRFITNYSGIMSKSFLKLRLQLRRENILSCTLEPSKLQVTNFKYTIHKKSNLIIGPNYIFIF